MLLIDRHKASSWLSCPTRHGVQSTARVKSHHHHQFRVNTTVSYATLACMLHLYYLTSSSAMAFEGPILTTSQAPSNLQTSHPTTSPNSLQTQVQSQQQQSQPQQAATAAATAPNGNFVIQILHSDSKTYVNFLPVNHSNLHEPRIELRYQSKFPWVSLDERTQNNTVVAAVVVTDDDDGLNGQTSLSIEHGNELGHFKLVSTQFSNTIQVNGAPLSKQNVPDYNLTIVARDHGLTPKSSAVNLVIKLFTSNSPNSPTPGAAPLETPGLKPPVTDLMYLGAMLVVIFSALILLMIIGCALVQKPKMKKGPPPRTTSATNSRLHPSDHCLCLGLTNL